jgi:hypothetical protein
MPLLDKSAHAEPLDIGGFATVGMQGYFSWIAGRMGFEQESCCATPGTLNDFKTDLGLTNENKTFQINMSVRPLEHHVLRLFGRIPEFYEGQTTTNRTLVSRINTYPAGTLLQSQLRTGMFGVGYDLDLLIGPKWFAGFQGEFRYVDLQVRMRDSVSGLEDTITLDEILPCLGAHLQANLPFTLHGNFGPTNIGGFSRMTWGMTPNYLNYVDLMLGGSITLRPTCVMAFDAKLGYEHESYFYNGNIQAKTVEMKRDGVFVSMEAAF